MTVVTTDFTGTNGTGTPPSPWIKHSNGDGVQAIQSNAWQINSSDGYAGDSMTYGTTVFTDCEVVAWVKLNPTTYNEQYPGIGLRLFDGTSGVDGWCAFAEPNGGYFLQMHTPSNRIEIMKGVDGGISSTLASVPFDWADAGNTTQYWVKFRAEGTDLMAKAWADGTSEPGSWTVTTSDSTYTSGKVGFREQAPANTTITTFDTFSIDDLVAGGTFSDDVTTTVVGITSVTDQIATVPKFKAAGTPTENISNSTIAWPTHVAGDVALLYMESCGGEAITLTNAQGFTQLPDSPSATGATTSGTRITVYWHRATSSSMAAPAFADAGNHVYGVILTFTDCIDSGNPYDVTAANVKATASTSMTLPGVTTTVPRALVVQAAARDNDNAAAAGSAPSNGNLANLTERFDLGTALGNGGGLMVWCGEKVAAGATGNTTATVTSSINAYHTVALKGNPPPAGSTNYTDDVTTTIVAVTSVVDQLAAVESVITTSVGITSDADSRAMAESVQSDVLGVTSIVGSRGMFEDLRTDVLAPTESADVGALVSNVQTDVLGITSEVDVVTYTESVQTDINALTGETDGMAFADIVNTVVVATTSEVDALAMTEAPVLTTIVATTTTSDQAGLTESVTTTVGALTSSSDQAAFVNSVQTDVTVTSGETEQLALFELVQTNVLGVTSETEQKAMAEAVQTNVVGVTSDTDSAAMVDNTQTNVVAATDVNDVQNNNPDPPTQSRQYFGSFVVNKV